MKNWKRFDTENGSNFHFHKEILNIVDTDTERVGIFNIHRYNYFVSLIQFYYAEPYHNETEFSLATGRYFGKI